MRRYATILFSLLLAALAPAFLKAPAAHAQTGDLGVFLISESMFLGVAPGDTVRVTAYYTWSASAPAPNVSVELEFNDAVFDFVSAEPAPTTSGGGSLRFDLGTVPAFAFEIIEIVGVVPPSVEPGTELRFSASISGSVTDDNANNDTGELVITVQAPVPDLWVWKWGLLEELEAGFLFAAEQDVPTNFTIYYFNWANFEAEDVVLTDSLPEGVTFISAFPEPTSTEGSVVRWNLGDLEPWASGEITLRVRPTSSGSRVNIASIATSSEEAELRNNRTTFNFEVVELLPPRLLKPNIIAGATDSPAIVGRNTAFQGLARAGATVTLYEGSEFGCFGDFSGCDASPLGSTVAGNDRRWSISGVLEEARTYYLYLRAEKDGGVSESPFQFYQPYAVRIDSILDGAGFDLDHFTIATANQEAEPGTLGGSSGMTPNEDWRLNIRQEAPDEILTNAEFQAFHELRLEIFGPTRETREVPPSDIIRVSDPEPGRMYSPYDFVYEEEGFPAGSRVEIWCLPVFYTEEGVPLVGLVYVKCHEMLIDPAGYVYDIEAAGSEYEWPSVPPEEALITDATVTALIRTGDDEWTRWPAEETGQVNPQVTDEVTNDRIQVAGYYAFYVPPGQFQVNASAPGYADYVSPILTVVDAPVFHNVGMRIAAEKTTSVEPPRHPGRDALPSAVLLHQNYPNPFNPSTTITYALMAPSEIELTVHNLLGQEVARLVDDLQQPGQHHVRFDAGDLPSGVYFYRLKAGHSSQVRKMTLVR